MFTVFYFITYFVIRVFHYIRILLFRAIEDDNNLMIKTWMQGLHNFITGILFVGTDGKYSWQKPNFIISILYIVSDFEELIEWILVTYWHSCNCKPCSGKSSFQYYHSHVLKMWTHIRENVYKVKDADHFGIKIQLCI